MTRSIFALLGAFALMACGSGFEAKDDPKPDSGTGGATGGSGGSGGSPTGGVSGGGGSTGGAGGSPNGCPPNHRCAPPAPSGWNGPYALTSDPTCPGSWGEEKLVVHDELSAGESECECGCTPTTGCPDAAGLLSFNMASCPTTSTATPTTLTVGTCKDAVSLISHAVVLGPATASCTPKVTENIAPAVWAVNDRLCGGASAAGQCENAQDSCLPSSQGALCIEQAGDLSCPSEYSAKTLYYTNLQDSRDCPATCPCTAGGAVECTAYFHSYAQLQCGPSATSGSVKSGGLACIGTSPSVKVDSISSSKIGTCTPGAAEPTGEVAPSDPHTVCCLP